MSNTNMPQIFVMVRANGQHEVIASSPVQAWLYDEHDDKLDRQPVVVDDERLDFEVGWIEAERARGELAYQDNFDQALLWEVRR